MQVAECRHPFLQRIPVSTLRANKTPWWRSRCFSYALCCRTWVHLSPVEWPALPQKYRASTRMHEVSKSKGTIGTSGWPNLVLHIPVYISEYFQGPELEGEERWVWFFFVHQVSIPSYTHYQWNAIPWCCSVAVCCRCTYNTGTDILQRGIVPSHCRTSWCLYFLEQYHSTHCIAYSKIFTFPVSCH